jgi:hypothetical protein
MGVPAAQLPALKIDVPDGFRSYPDQPKREDQLKENGVLGILQEKLALVPTRPGTLRLPEIKIDWWDLDDERWHQARLPALDVEVLPATNQPAVTATPPAVPQQEPLPQEDKPRVEVPTLPTPEEQGFWPWLSIALGGGWLLTLLFIVKGKLVKRNQEKKQEQQEDRPDLKTARKRCEPLKQKLELFSRSLYSRESNDWDSHGLSAAVQEVQQKATKAENYKKLPPLYPH